jgi:membrane fusion protein, multidrug efflux system
MECVQAQKVTLDVIGGGTFRRTARGVWTLSPVVFLSDEMAGTTRTACLDYGRQQALLAAIALSGRPPMEAITHTTNGIALSPQGARGRHDRFSFKQLLLAAGALALVAAAAAYGEQWWSPGRFHASSNETSVAADPEIVSSGVSGYLSLVLVGDKQPVVAGQVLARIDDRHFRTALDQVTAKVIAARTDADNLQEEIKQQMLVVRRAHIEAEVDDAELAVAQRQPDELQGRLRRAQATLASREVAERQAELYLSYTTIVAPVDGTVHTRRLRVGQYVQADREVMAVVPLEAIW